MRAIYWGKNVTPDMVVHKKAMELWDVIFARHTVMCRMLGEEHAAKYSKLHDLIGYNTCDCIKVVIKLYENGSVAE